MLGATVHRPMATDYSPLGDSYWHLHITIRAGKVYKRIPSRVMKLSPEDYSRREHERAWEACGERPYFLQGYGRDLEVRYQADSRSIDDGRGAWYGPRMTSVDAYSDSRMVAKVLRAMRETDHRTNGPLAMLESIKAVPIVYVEYGVYLVGEGFVIPADPRERASA